ncbi:MAG: hypothetical protein K2K25_09790 [Muribaculaceae bacterium]|nr:hypothetical protein [Muribaculaceae bacterium]
MNERSTLNSDGLYRKEDYRKWLRSKAGLSKGSADSYISYMNSLNKYVNGKNGKDFHTYLSSLLNDNRYAEIIVLLEDVDRTVSKIIDCVNTDGGRRKKLNDCRSSLRRYMEFLMEELEDFPDEEEMEELNDSFPMELESGDSQHSASDGIETYDYKALEDNFRFRLLTQNRMSGKKDVFYPIGIIRKLFRYSQNNDLSSENEYDWLIKWMNDCVGEIRVLTNEYEVPLHDVDYLMINPQSKSVEITRRNEDNQDHVVYTETNKESEGAEPMAVDRLRDVHIDHSPLMSRILSEELPNLKALPRLTEIIKQVAKSHRIDVTTRNFGKISKKLFADKDFVEEMLLPMIPDIKKDLNRLHDKSTLKLMQASCNLRKK